MELTKEELELVIGWLEDHYYYPNKDHVYTDTDCSYELALGMIKEKFKEEQ